MKNTNSRRNFLKLGMLAAALPFPAFASQGSSAAERRLGFLNLHTGGKAGPPSTHMLAGNSSGVAKRSLHMEGKAIDIRLPGIQLADLRRAGLMLRSGGVGYYPGSNFVHLDVGRVRTWGGSTHPGDSHN